MVIQEDLGSGSRFAVNLDVFSGPFEVLLSLISKHRLDVTDVALAKITDEFIAFVRDQDEAALDQMSEFVVVAATLLDLKAARLLPRDEREDDDLLALFEARDVLFAKLLQYRAFKKVAVELAQRMREQSLSFARDVPVEPEFSQIRPPVEIRLSPVELALFAASVFARKPNTVATEHIHDPLVPVESQVVYIRERLAVGESITFGDLCSDAPDVSTVVSRFLAVLDLLRRGEIECDQTGPLAPLTITRIVVANGVALKSIDRSDAERSPNE